MSTPLLDISTLPPFSKIKAEQIEPTIDQILADNRKKLKTLLKQNENKISWQTIIQPLEEMDNVLSKYWSPVRHLNSVMSSDEIRKAHDACIPKLSAYSTEQAQNEDLYQAYKSIYKSEDFNSLEDDRKRTIENALLKFKLSGIALDKNNKEKFKQIKQHLSELKTKFEHNVLDATQEWKLHITKESVLAGLPDYAKAMGKQEAKNEKVPGWIFTLDAPSFMSIMTYADDRELREEMYQAFTTRASNEGPDAGKFDNTDKIEEILEQRLAMAKLLGFDNYAELSIADKMAETTDDVLKFLNDLVSKSYPLAIKEIEQLKVFAKEECDIDDLQAWDVAYCSEKLKQQEYGISQEELKPYFPAPKVIQGLFNIVKQLYGISIEQKQDMDVWHKDVTFYEITDDQGELRGAFYLDLYARANKRGGAWMDECVSRMVCDNKIQTPVAYLTCNLTPPVDNDPALLTHDEVTTLFHEFGHGLHHMLTKVNALFVSGINGVEWDAVELPSQFMENWCWEKEGLEMIASHYQSGESLPEDLFNKLIKAKNFQSAMFMVRQLEFALFDFRLHMEYGTDQFKGVQALLDEIRQQVAVVIPPKFNKFQNSFTHIFAGGYSAGYYSYKWAEVLSADAFSMFEEKGIFDEDTGKAFLHNILEKGGSAKAMELFKSFRGREPQIDALLRHSGLS
ncbi:MAG: oligopeptidase A [Gammaproteobacteria bacterium]|nr:oligopeptidase A [Gammaproteobacteria bacterium]MCW8911216.1 oligopeptidase A [Gammaproteobacteria bacterium]MCW9005473.1 oligopeptidase A [Gammaproteobacteria bacterium]